MLFTMWCFLALFPAMAIVSGHTSLLDEMARFKAQAHLGAGVVIDPAGWLLVGAGEELLPLIVSLKPLQVDMRDIVPSCAEEGKLGPKGTQEVFSYTALVTPFLTQVIQKAQATYGGVLDEHFYAELFSEVCESTGTMCEQVSHRPKRALTGGLVILGLLGATGAGGSIFNAWQNSKMSSRVSALERQIGRVLEETGATATLIQNLTASNNAFISDTEHEFEKLWAYAQQSRCEFERHTVIQDLRAEVRAMTTALARRIDFIMAHAAEAKLSPLLAPPDKLSDTIKSSPRLVDTLIAHEPSLAYTFGNAYPLRIDFENLQFAFALRIPIVPRTHLKPLFRIHNVGWIDNGTLHRLDLPTYVTMSNTTGDMRYRAVQQKDCTTKEALWLCPSAATQIAAQNECLQSLNKNRLSASCRIDISNPGPDTVIRGTHAGVLARTTQLNFSFTVDPATSQNTRQLTRHVGRNGVVWMPYTSFTFLTLADQLIPSYKTARRINITEGIRTVPSLNFTGIAPPKWADIDAIKAYNERIGAEAGKIVERARQVIPSVGVTQDDVNVLLYVVVFAQVAFVLYLLKGRMPCACKVCRRDDHMSTPTPMILNDISPEEEPGYTNIDQNWRRRPWTFRRPRAITEPPFPTRAMVPRVSSSSQVESPM
jgi:hypothetical protein